MGKTARMGTRTLWSQQKQCQPSAWPVRGPRRLWGSVEPGGWGDSLPESGPMGRGGPGRRGGVLQAKQLDGDGSLGRACRPAHHTQPSLVSRPRPQQAARAPRGEDTANTQYLPVE